MAYGVCEPGRLTWANVGPVNRPIYMRIRAFENLFCSQRAKWALHHRCVLPWDEGSLRGGAPPWAAATGALLGLPLVKREIATWSACRPLSAVVTARCIKRMLM